MSQRALLKHQKEEAAKNGDDQDADSDMSQQQVDMPGLRKRSRCQQPL